MTAAEIEKLTCTVIGCWNRSARSSYWAEVASRLERTSARLRAGEVSYQPLAGGSSGDLDRLLLDTSSAHR